MTGVGKCGLFWGSMYVYKRIGNLGNKKWGKTTLVIVDQDDRSSCVPTGGPGLVVLPLGDRRSLMEAPCLRRALLANDTCIFVDM